MTPTSKPIDTDTLTAERAVLGVVHTVPDTPLPPGACDCHVHVFGAAGQYAFAPDRVFMPSPATVDDLIAHQQALGLDRVVVVQASPQGTNNTCLFDTLQTLQQRGREARGVAVVSPSISDSCAQALREAGVRGLRVNLQSYGTSDPDVAAQRLRETATVAARYGWHVQVYTKLSVIEAVADEVVQLGVPMVIDHFALAAASGGTEQAGFATLCELVRSGHVYVKLSAPYRIVEQPDGSDGTPVVRALIDANPSRMLWGTDWPHTYHSPGLTRLRDRPEPFQPIDDGEQLEIFLRWTTPEERQRILVDNPQTLYEFSPQALPHAR